MLIQSIERLFVYNQWAWNRVFPSLEALAEEEYFAERPFFWNSFHGLAIHGYSVERNWLRRARDASSPSPVTREDFSSFAALRDAWELTSVEWQEFVGSLTPSALAQSVAYRDDEGEAFDMLLDDVLRHVVIHATEHRSQMTPTLARLGHPTEPLDFADFALS